MLYTALRLVTNNGSTHILIARHNNLKELDTAIRRLLLDNSLPISGHFTRVDKGETFRTYNKAEAQYCAFKDNSLDIFITYKETNL